MVLTELRLAGFKSFASETTLSFDPGLTVVLGPNGSGKSNLAEAIRWVLGEQSLKTLRGAATEDILFAGSAGRRRRAMAHVQLLLDNSAGRFPLDAAEIALERIVRRGGEGAYLVNGAAVRLFDLRQMLAEAGIGAKSYTVIGQGMVDQYVRATPAQRLELFDEACGVRSMKLKLHKAERQGVRADQQYRELRAQLRELVPRRRVLADQAERAKRRDGIEKKWRKLQLLHYHARWHRQRKKIQRDEAAAERAREHLAAAQQERERAEAQLVGAAEERDAAERRSAPVNLLKLLQHCMALIAAVRNDQRPPEAALARLEDLLTRAAADVRRGGKQARARRSALQDAMAAARGAELEAQRADGALEAGLAQAHTDLAGLEAEILRDCGEGTLQDIQHSTMPEQAKHTSAAAVQKLEHELARLGEIDEIVVKEFEEVAARCAELEAHIRDIQKTRRNISLLARQLSKTIEERFAAQLSQLNRSFDGAFRALFGGGEAQLRIVSGAEDGAVEGIEIAARLPDKQARKLELLSGGEKALCGLALLLAIVEVQRPPFVVLDEIDAALDEANSARFAALLKERSRQTQCIVISHNRETMAQADVLYGIAMGGDGISKVYSVRMKDVAGVEREVTV